MVKTCEELKMGMLNSIVQPVHVWGLTTSLDFACSLWHRFFSFMEPKHLPTGVCLWDTAKESPPSLSLQYQQINSYSPTPPSHSLFLDWNWFLQSMEEFLLYTFYPSKSFIYVLKPFTPLISLLMLSFEMSLFWAVNTSSLAVWMKGKGRGLKEIWKYEKRMWGRTCWT